MTKMHRSLAMVAIVTLVTVVGATAQAAPKKIEIQRTVATGIAIDATISILKDTMINPIEMQIGAVTKDRLRDVHLGVRSVRRISEVPVSSAIPLQGHMIPVAERISLKHILAAARPLEDITVVDPNLA